MIRTECNATSALLLYLQHGAEELVCIQITLKGPFLIEIALGSLLYGTQMNEVDAVAETAHHRY